MCDFHEALRPLDADEYYLDTPRVREFIAEVRRRRERATSAVAACELISPLFEDLLRDQDWLPSSHQAPAPESGMGGGIGQWLAFRSRDRALTLFSLVVPPGAMTPIHDHLAWGLIGLYRGTQDEEFHAPGEDGIRETRRRPLNPGDYYTLLPPDYDVHRVRTTSEQTSVSIHLLANDTGCVWRHTYDERTGEQQPFRSGYVNAECQA